MLVKDLIRKLEKCDQDAIVAIENVSLYINGTYEVTEVETYEEGIVYVATDHEKLLEEY